ncbi:MAG: FKBP-type peptidyl-prolyl cis-trans isomerase [Bacteroidota bacterium]
MKISVILLAASLLALPVYSQNKNKSMESSKTITTTSGLKYEILQQGNGRSPVKNGKVTVHYTGRLTNDTIFDSSVKRGQPFSFKLGAGQVIKGWDEGIALLKVGDKARLTIPPNLGYGDRNMGTIPPNSTLIFEVELLDAKDPFVPVPYNVSGKDTLQTASGLKWIRLNENATGLKAEPNKTVSVHYTGYFEDGKIFDSSVERDQPIQFPLGQGRVIKGWDEGIGLLRTGEKARLIIPYQLAYGEAGRPPVIPAKATLIFDVELVDVK